MIVMSLVEYFMLWRLRANPTKKLAALFYLSNGYPNQVLNLKFSVQPINVK